jgi:hypothetical protein
VMTKPLRFGFHSGRQASACDDHDLGDPRTRAPAGTANSSSGSHRRRGKRSVHSATRAQSDSSRYSILQQVQLCSASNRSASWRAC